MKVLSLFDGIAGARQALKELQIDLDIIKQKMRKNHLGEVNGYGLVALPAKK